MQVARPAGGLAGGILGVIAGLVVTSPTLVNAFSTRVAALGLIPILTILTPIQEQPVSGTVLFSVQADSSGVVSLQFKIDGKNFGTAITAGPCRASWDSAQAGDGLHTIEAVGIDQFGNTTMALPVTVLVNNHTTPFPPAPEPAPTPPPAGPIRDPATPLAVPRPKPSFALSLQTTGGYRFSLTSILHKDGLVLPGIRVTFVVTGPRGSRQVYRATTNSEGVATAIGLLRFWDRRGVYRVVATAAATHGEAPASVTGSFTY